MKKKQGFIINLQFALFYCVQLKNNNAITVFYFGYKSNILARSKKNIKKRKNENQVNEKIIKSKIETRQDFHHIEVDRNAEIFAKHKDGTSSLGI